MMGGSMTVAMALTMSMAVTLCTKLSARVCKEGQERQVRGGQQTIHRNGAPVEVRARVSCPDHCCTSNARCNALSSL